MPSEHGPVRTFLIADVRGYTRFTQEYGDEAAGRLTAKFADIVREGVEMRSGTVIEIRGDEALVVFESARQAIRAAKDLQQMFKEETDADRDLPLNVGIGIDSGEAVELEDGYRGNALNVASRLCALAHGGEVLVSEGTRHLAGHLPGLRYIDRGTMQLKGIDAPVHPMRVAWEDERVKDEPRNWVVMFLGGQRRLGWKPLALVIGVAAATAAAVVYLTVGRGASESQARGKPASDTSSQSSSTTTSEETAKNATLADLVPAKLWRDCKDQTVPEPNAIETAVCLPPDGVPTRWQLSMYPNGQAVDHAYDTLRKNLHIARDSGRCTRLYWGGEYAWVHGPGKPGGRAFCYFDGDDAVIVWIHRRLGQPTHRNVLGIAQEAGSDHARLIRWWQPWHHLVGKVVPGQ